MGDAPGVADLRRPPDSLTDPLRIPVLPRGNRAVVIRPPGSKSLTNRALLLAALAEGESVLHGALLDADDAQRMLAAVSLLGASVRVEGGTVRVRGVGGRWTCGGEVRVDVGNAGTAARFLAGAALLSPEPVVIDGDARMRERPIGELGALLEGLGATVEYLGKTACPPVRIVPPKSPPTGGMVRVPTTRSSQFVSAVLMAGACLQEGLTIEFSGEVTSASYVAMTVGLLRRVGARVEESEDGRIIHIAGGGLHGFEYDVEADASGATYFWAAAALREGLSVGIEGLSRESLQADVGVAIILERAGARRWNEGGGTWISGRTISPMDVDLRDMPDAAMTLASVCAFAPGESRLAGLQTLRDKETDRIEAMRVELGRVGVEVRVTGDDAMTIRPPKGGVDVSPSAPPVRFETYNDHRMAMSLAIIGLRRPNVWINDPGCVRKTYPGFWADLSRLYDRG